MAQLLGRGVALVVLPVALVSWRSFGACDVALVVPGVALLMCRNSRGVA